MKRTIFIFFLLFGSFCLAQTVELPEALNHSHVSFVVSDVATGETIVAHNVDQVATPASITKLITTATAIELLGPDFRFVTQIGTNGTICGGVLKGDLIVVGGGDPSLGSKFSEQKDVLQDWCEGLKRLKIKKITGGIVVDASCYETCALPSSWLLQDVGNFYSAGVFGLSFADNTTNILLRTGDVGSTPEIVDISPKSDQLEIVNLLQVGTVDSAYVFGLPRDNHRVLSGKLQANSKNYWLKADMPNPPLCFAENLRNALIDNGICVVGKCEESSANGVKICLFRQYSQPLAELCRVTNFWSNNNFAEHILKQISLQADSVGTLVSALRIEKNFWENRGIDFTAINICDGSGLSRKTRFSANFLSQILIQMSKSPNFETFLQTIPQAGSEGTVKSFMTQSDAKIYAKSGSMNGVQSYAGYIVRGEKMYSFCIIVNGFDSQANVRKAIEKLLTESIPAC